MGAVVNPTFIKLKKFFTDILITTIKKNNTGKKYFCFITKFFIHSFYIFMYFYTIYK